MELTAKTLQEVTFGSSKVRGYNPAEVDQFIEAVAEGVEELRERLRRAVERATRAEQAAAAAESAAPAAGVTAAPAGQPEISKVWERAVAAAEQAVSEAKAEAEALLAEAHAEATSRTTSANQEADTRLSTAKSESESLVSNAQAEAYRIAEESQAQLRDELAALEAARETLKGDVDRLGSFLSGEKDRLRGRIHQALGALDSYGSDAANAPALSNPNIPDPRQAPASSSASVAPSFYESAAPSFSPEPEPISFIPETSPESQSADAEGDSDAESDSAAVDEAPAAPAPLDVPQYSSEAVSADTEQQAWGQSEWTAPDEVAAAAEPEANEWGNPGDPSWGDTIAGEPEPPQISWGEAEEAAAEEAPAEAEAAAEPAEPEDEGDPFLAELRKAVQDDGPLGPRDEVVEDGSSIDSLYANEDEDRSGFFRRKK